MNLKNFILRLGTMFIVTLFLLGVTNAQTFFVNNQTGNDANPGSQALPKLTVASAIIAAPPGSTISVANTGISYTEGNITINKALTFTSTGGMPIFANASIDVQVNTTLTGPLQFVNLTLTAGTVTGATNLTVSGNVTRSAAAATVDGQINYTAGAHNFTYAGGAAVTSGGELPAAGDLTHLGNLTTVGAGTVLTLNSVKQINGTINTAAALNLGGNIITIAGASAGHVVGGDVTNGTLAFVITGAAQISGAFKLPNVTATKTTAGIAALDLTGITAVQSLTASGNADVDVNDAATIGDAGSSANNLVNSGNGVIDVLRAGAVTVNGNVLLNSTGLDAATEGQINFAQGGNLTINGNVTNDAGLTVADNAALNGTGVGLITFVDQTTTITGNVVNDVLLSGVVNTATQLNAVGNIIFNNVATNVTINGAITNSASTSIVSGANILGFTNSGTISLVTITTGVVRADGGITITSDFDGLTHADLDNNGNGTVLIGAGVRTAGSTVGTLANRVGAISISSSSQAHGLNGSLIIGGDALTGGFFGTSVSVTGGVGGQAIFNEEDFNINGGVLNSRTSTNGDDAIVVGAAARAGAVVNIGGGLTNQANTDIVFNTSSTGNVTVTGTVASTVANGQITFPNITTGAIAFGGINITAGTINVPATHSANINVNGAWTVEGGTLNLMSDGSGDDIAVSQTIHPNISWKSGTIDFTGRDDIQIGSINTIIGGATTNPTFVGAAELVFVEPLPNVVQNIYVGGASPVYPGPLTINNSANIPAPIVNIEPDPANGLAVANLFVLNDVTFSSGTVINSIELDGVRLSVGKNGLGGGNGNFQNTSGYVTVDGGLVMMSGTSAAQTVNAAAVNAGATFGAFGVDNERDPLPLDGVAEVTFGVGTVFTTDFYLAEGDVDLTNTTFQGTGPNWPTVFRTEGAFTTAPTVAAGTRISVTYYGFDKATGLEIPLGAGVLHNLTVSTTNGVENGKGIVNMSGAATVNGTLTIDANQSLYTGANLLTLEGASAVINGNLVDDGGAPNVLLSAATGTTLSGTGTLPSLSVDAGSVGNSLSGFPRLVAQAFGANNVWGGAGANADDFATADGIITYVGGAASSLTVAFGGNGPHFTNLTTAAGATFTLGANVVMAGDINHVAGTIAIGDFVLDHQGVAPSITGGATITSNAAGKLLFQTGSPNLTILTGAATIAANTEFSSDGGTFSLLAASQNLTISGNLTLTDKTAGAPGASFDIGAGRTLTAAGANVTVGANSGFTASGAATGILLLDVAAPNTLLTYNTPAASTVANLTIADNVALGGGILGGTLIVNGNHGGVEFNHNGGDINIGTANLQIGTGATNTDYTRTAGTYSGDGFLVWNSAGVFTHGPALSINRLRTTTNLSLVSASTVTVNDWLDLDGGIVDHTVGAGNVGFLVIGDANGVIVEVDGTGNLATGGVNVAATFGAGPTDYRFTNASSVPNTFTWPEAQARNVLVNLANNANTVTVGANKTINGDVDITLGDIVWDGPQVITIASGSTITRRNDGSILNNDADGDKNAVGGEVGTLTAPNVNLAYQSVASANINTALEYTAPVIVNNFTLLDDGDANAATQTTVTVVASRTIAGLLALNSQLTFAANTVTNFPLAQTIAGTGTVILAAGAPANAVVNWNAGLTVAGAYVNNGTTNIVGGLTATGPVTNNSVMNLDGYTQTGNGLTQGVGSTITLTGDAVFNNLVLPAAIAPPGVVAPIITTNSDIEINGTVTNTYLDLVFGGAVDQTLALGGNRTLNNLTIAKTSDKSVFITEGNLTLNAAAGAAPNGILTLTRGVLNVANPNMLTLQLTAAGGFIANIGYVRNPANLTDLAHVVGRLGVALPAGIIGRAEWPVGSADAYRPASLTFTAGNALIAPTTIVVEHVDGTPAGEVNLPLNGGVKFDNPAETNWIGDKAPYSWLVRATTSLGASQKFDIELQGTELNRPFENVNDLRIIRRFDGDVNVNGWFLQGAADMYSNILQENQPAVGDTIVTARNQNSQGGIVTQAAFFTIGIPVGVQTEFDVTGTVTYGNNAATPLAGVDVTLTPGGLTATTDANGNFTIANVGNGTYTVTASSDSAWEGANSTDALDVLLYTVGSFTMNALQQDAADVNASNTVTSLDALQILQRDATVINSFTAGDWVFESKSVVVNNGNATVNLKGLATGDVNASNNPTLAKVAPINFTQEGKINVNPGKDIQIPVKVGTGLTVGAMTLSLTYPADLVVYEGISSSAKDLVVKAKDGKINISWASLSAIDVKADEALFTLKFKQAKEFKAGSVVNVEVVSGEVADAKGNVVNAAFKIASVEGYVPSEFALKQNYPNPFNPQTTIAYDLPVDGMVNLTIFNALGEQVATIVNEMQTAGAYTQNWNASTMTSGIYLYRIDVKAGDKSFTKVQKMILMK